MVRFETVVGKQEAIQGSIYHFDNKPLIVKEWSLHLEFTREKPLTVPIWIKFPRLNFKYWRPKGLSKIGSLVKKPLIVDHNTRKKNLKFTRLLVEVKMGVQLPDVVIFRNEKGKLIEQNVSYDWKPTLCKHSSKYGHTNDEYKLKKKQPNTPQEQQTKPIEPKQVGKGKVNERPQATGLKQDDRGKKLDITQTTKLTSQSDKY